MCPTKRGVAPTGCPDVSAPDTDFLSAPVGGIAKGLTVPFGFVATEAGVSYQCSLDGALFAACPNPTTVTVGPGRHTFRVAARDTSGNVDPYPAATTFTAYDCPTLTKAVAKLGKMAKAVKKAINRTERQLAEAKADGDRAEVAQLKDKLQKLEKKQDRTANKLTRAKRAAQPCKASTGSVLGGPRLASASLNVADGRITAATFSASGR